MLQASLGASIVSLGALLSVARRVRRKDHSLHSSSTASSTAGLGSSQCATLWLRSLCGDPASSSSWLTEQQQPALLVFHAEGQQLARVAGPPSAPNTGHACKHELVMGACEAASSLEAALTSSDGDPLLLPLDALFCATAVHVEEQQPCLVFASMWAGSKVLTASKEPGHHPTLKPFTGSNAQKWTLDDSGEIVNARWPDRALGMSGQRVQATRTADALQHDRASCTKIQELEYNLEVMEEQHSCLVDALEAEHQEQLQGLQQQCELEQRKSRGQEEKLEGLAGLVGQLQSRLGREQAASRHASEQLQQERARVTAVEEQLEAAHAQLRMLAGQAAQKQQEAAGAKAALVAAHERQLAALQQQRQEALLESTRLRQEVEQMRKDLASMTSAKDEAFRFLETVRAQTHQKDQVNEALLDKCCTLDATLQAINSKIGIICNERRTEPLQRSLQAADLGRLRRRLDQIKDSCNSSAFASPVLALPETRGHRSPFVLQLPHGADESQNAEGMGSNSRSQSPVPAVSPGCGFESDKSEESQRVEGIVRALEEESSSSDKACSLSSIMRTARSMRESMRASIRASMQLGAGMPGSHRSEGGSAHMSGGCSGSSSMTSEGSSNGSNSQGVESEVKRMSGAGGSKRVLGGGRVSDAVRHHEARQRQQQADASRSLGSVRSRVAADAGSRPESGGSSRAMGGVWNSGGVVDKGPKDRSSGSGNAGISGAVSSSSSSSSSSRLRVLSKAADPPALACGSAGDSSAVKRNSAGGGDALKYSTCSGGNKEIATCGSAVDSSAAKRNSTGDRIALENSVGGSKDSAGHGGSAGDSGACNKGSTCSGRNGSTAGPSSTALWLQHLQASYLQPPSLATTPGTSPLPPSLQAASPAGQSPGTPSLRKQAAHAAAAASMSTPFQAEQPPAHAPSAAGQREGRGNTASSTPCSSSSRGSRETTIVHHHHHCSPQSQEAQQGSCQGQPMLQQQQQQQQQQQTLQMRRAPGIPLPALRVDSGDRDVPFFSATNSQSNTSSACNTCCNMGSTRVPPEGSQWGGCTPNYHSHCGTPSYAPNHAKTASYCSQVNLWPGTPQTPSQQYQQQDEQTSHVYAGATAVGMGGSGCTQQHSHQKQTPQLPPLHAHPHHHRRNSSVMSPLQPAWVEQGLTANPKQASTRGAADDVKGIDQHADVSKSMAGANLQADGLKVGSNKADQRKGDVASCVNLRNTRDWAQQERLQQQQQPEGAGGDGSGACWEDESEEVDVCASPLFSGVGVQLLQSLQQLRNTPNKRQLSTLRDGDSSDEEGGRASGF